MAPAMSWIKEAQTSITKVVAKQEIATPKLWKLPESECPDVWIRLPRHKWPNSWSDIEDPAVPLERNLCGHPLGGLLWERPFAEVLLGRGWRKIPKWECLYVIENKDRSFWKTWMIKNGWKNAEYGLHVEEVDEIGRILDNQHLS